VCNSSSSPEYAEFPYGGGLATTIINPGLGSCWVSESPFSGISSDEAVGYRYVNGAWQAFTYQYFDDANVTDFTF
jgi:hypothetical protein